MLKYKIPFKKKLFIEQTKLTLPYIYSNQYKRIKNSAIFTLLFFSIGIIVLLFGSELSTLFFSIAIFGTFDLYTKQEGYKVLKDAHIRATREFTENVEIELSGIFEFRKDCFRFSNDFLCTWVYWKDFEKYIIKDSNLLLVHKVFKEDIFVISATEVNKHEFEKILNFIKNKIN